MSAIVTPETRGFSFSQFMKTMARRSLNRMGHEHRLIGRVICVDRDRFGMPRGIQTVATNSTIHPIVKLWGEDGYARHAVEGDKVEMFYRWDPNYGGRWFGRRVG